METPEMSAVDLLRQYLSEFTAGLKKEQEDAEDGGEETLVCSSQDDTGGRESRTSDVVCSSSSVPPSVPNSSEDSTIVILNVTSCVQLGCVLNLDYICRKTWNTEYNSFKRLIMRIRKPRTAAIIFKSGTLICTGAKSIEDSHRAARRFARIIQKLGFPVHFKNFKIGNIMASSSIFPVDLIQLFHVYRKKCSYEPELFPSLFFKLDSGISAQIFPKGKLCLSGAKNIDELHEAFRTISSILLAFRRS